MQQRRMQIHQVGSQLSSWGSKSGTTSSAFLSREHITTIFTINSTIKPCLSHSAEHWKNPAKHTVAECLTVKIRNDSFQFIRLPQSPLLWCHGGTVLTTPTATDWMLTSPGNFMETSLRVQFSLFDHITHLACEEKATVGQITIQLSQ